MNDMSDSSTSPDDSSKPVESPPRPKRGAFPTPKSEIEKATPYVPDTGEEDGSEGKSDRPTDVDGEK